VNDASHASSCRKAIQRLGPIRSCPRWHPRCYCGDSALVGVVAGRDTYTAHPPRRVVGPGSNSRYAERGGKSDRRVEFLPVPQRVSNKNREIAGAALTLGCL